jgi:hypothetical protein
MFFYLHLVNHMLTHSFVVQNEIFEAKQGTLYASIAWSAQKGWIVRGDVSIQTHALFLTTERSEKFRNLGWEVFEFATI